MYQKIKNEIAQTYYVQNFPNEGQRFVAWYVRNIHGQDANQTKYCITDGADDKQIDAIVIDDEQSVAYIIQGKFIETSLVDAEPLREVISSWTQLRDLAKLQENANGKLKQRLSDLATALEDGYDVHFELIVTSNLTEAAHKDLASFQKALAESDDFSASLTLVDPDELQRRYELALEKENPFIKHQLTLEHGKYVAMKLAETSVVIAAIPLKSCLSFPGIKDGALFQKNVRQSLGLSNSVNKQIKATIYSDRHRDFFFFHNGITAICSQMNMEGDELKMQGLSVVNGCQSLTTILSCSEEVKKLADTYVMFRFYEIPQHDRADKISTSTNSQSTVKPRDLRSNDKRVSGSEEGVRAALPGWGVPQQAGRGCPRRKRQEQGGRSVQFGQEPYGLAFPETEHLVQRNQDIRQIFRTALQAGLLTRKGVCLAGVDVPDCIPVVEGQPIGIQRDAVGDAFLCAFPPSLRNLDVLRGCQQSC